MAIRRVSLIRRIAGGRTLIPGVAAILLAWVTAVCAACTPNSEVPDDAGVPPPDASVDEGSEPQVPSITCVAAAVELTGDPGIDLVGTWVSENVEIYHGLTPITELRADGSLRQVVGPSGVDEDSAGSVTEGAWSVLGDIVALDFYLNGNAWERRVWRMSESSVRFYAETSQVGQALELEPWLRVECAGFGFGDRTLPEPVSCDPADDAACAESLDGPTAACVELDDHWGNLAVCAFERTEPSPMLDVSGVTDFDHGGAFTCAVLADQSIECWGQAQIVPPVDGAFTRVAVGGASACGITTSGEVRCWGSASYGQHDVPPDLRLAELSMGPTEACGLTPEGTIVCWGDGPIGQAPPPVGQFVEVSVGESLACARRADRTLTCWGPPTSDWDSVPSGEFVDVDAGLSSACAVADDGAMSCWGLRGFTPSDERFAEVSVDGQKVCGVKLDGLIDCWPEDLPQSLEPVTSVDVGYENLCALRANSTLLCWGKPYDQFRISP